MGKYAIHQSDQNEKRLIEYLRARGAQVEKIHQPLDLLVTYLRVSGLAEVKKPNGKLSLKQQRFMLSFRGVCEVLHDEGDCNDLLEQLEILSKRGAKALFTDMR